MKIGLNSLARTCCLASKAVLLLGMAYPERVDAATYVAFDTVLGVFYAEMFDEPGQAPLTVDNFLDYSNSGAYDRSIIHRSDRSVSFNSAGDLVYRPFVIQGGEVAIDDEGDLFSIPSNDPVMNEPGISNLRGTIALARVGGMVNSGTNNWFINLSDNTFLDSVDEGFTVFGEVLGDGMEIVDAISELPTLPLNNSFGDPIFTTVPFRGDLNSGVTEDNFVVINQVIEVDLRPGDYNRDGKVNIADYTIWRDSLGSTTNLAADGNANNVVDTADFAVWKDHFGLTPTPVFNSQLLSAKIPEPSALTTLAVVIALGSFCRWLAGVRLKSPPAQKKRASNEPDTRRPDATVRGKSTAAPIFIRGPAGQKGWVGLAIMRANQRLTINAPAVPNPWSNWAALRRLLGAT